MSGNEARTPEAEDLVEAVGAALFASDEPVDPNELSEAFGEIGRDEVEAAMDRLDAAHREAGTGLRVEKIAGGYRLSTRPEAGAWVRLFLRNRNRARLTPAALETLAIVAYRQPVTVPEIQAIRGKDPTAALKNLLDKRLVRILGKKKVVGSPLLYGTSKQFLIHFGLDSLADLPSIEEFDEFVESLESPGFELLRGEAPEAAGDGDVEAAASGAGDESPGEDGPATAATEFAADESSGEEEAADPEKAADPTG